jgi:hypothetical protein
VDELEHAVVKCKGVAECMSLNYLEESLRGPQKISTVVVWASTAVVDYQAGANERDKRFIL